MSEVRERRDDARTAATGHRPAAGQAASQLLTVCSISTGAAAMGSPCRLTTRRTTLPRVSPLPTDCADPLTTTMRHSPELTA